MSRNIEKQIRNLGYDREDLNIADIDYITHKDLSKKTICHSISVDKKINDVNFDYAAATGSLYTKCVFSDCSMDQTDFEFCSFKECSFNNNKKIISSFNNSNFINTYFEDDDFEACTFCGVLFDNCHFKNLKITLSTFEGAYFNSCSFENMDLSLINMDYIQLEKPTMKDVTLPFSQIPYMFGALQYLHNTNDKVCVSSNSTTMSRDDYFEKAIPKLIKYWQKSREKQPEYNFPLANIYILKNQKGKAIESVFNGLKAAVDENDYRMIKYYCKLISISNYFENKIKEIFYSVLCSRAPNKGINDLDTRNFMRNIEEIRQSLFSLDKKSSLFTKLLTNLHFYKSKEVGEILNRLFSLTKMKHKVEPNNFTITLSENSPFIIELNVKGNEDNIMSFFMLLNKICNIDNNIIALNDSTFDALVPLDSVSKSNADDLASYCAINNIVLSFMEYQISNCKKCEEIGISPFYYRIDSANEMSLLMDYNGEHSDI